MATVKVSELIGVALDWAVAQCEGVYVHISKITGFATWVMFDSIAEGRKGHSPKYRPSSDWAQGGPIIERELMDIRWIGVNNVRASIEWLDEQHFEAHGPTPLIAAMRCYVASKMGEIVEIPEELWQILSSTPPAPTVVAGTT